MGKYEWIMYVALAGLAWGTYVPIIFYGGNELGAGKPGVNARLMAVLCVGAAYFVIGVIFPLIAFLTGWQPWPEVNTTGLAFSGLAGVAGAVGAICVIFATKAAVEAGMAQTPPDRNAFKVYIAPLIFGLAPIINVLVSMLWHPQVNDPFHFSWESPHWLLWVGIVLVGLGAGLVLYSKELTESSHVASPPAPKVSAGHDSPPPLEATP
jgi:drug/metabolite transporter (DMT)-like permease